MAIEEHCSQQTQWWVWRVVQLLSLVWLFEIPLTAARQASLSFAVSWSLLTLISIEFVHWAIPQSNSLSSPSPPALDLSQHQGLFQGVGFLNQVAASTSASVLPRNIQGWFPFGSTGLISLKFKGLSRVFSNSSVQFNCSVVSHSLRPHGLQHARPPCPSPTPGVYSNSCLFSRWCHRTISSSVVPFSPCLQSFPASGSSYESKKKWYKWTYI